MTVDFKDFFLLLLLLSSYNLCLASSHKHALTLKNIIMCTLKF